MDLDTAKELMAHINAASSSFSDLSHAIDKLDEHERVKFKLGLGKAMGELYLELIYPIGLQHPELDPANLHKMNDESN